MSDEGRSEQQPQSENSREIIVELNQEFDIFAPSRTKKNPYTNNDQFSSEVVLRTGLLPDLPLGLQTLSSKTRKVSSITPFDPELGYTITQEDYDLQSRRAKYNASKSDFDQVLDFNKVPLGLRIGNTHSTSEVKAGLSEKASLFGSTVKAQYKPILDRLRVQVSFPNGLIFEARPYQIGIELGKIEFLDFYPADRGPLPVDNSDPRRFREGLSLYMPADLVELSQIKAKFIILPEEEEEYIEEKEPTDERPLHNLFGTGDIKRKT